MSSLFGDDAIEDKIVTAAAAVDAVADEEITPKNNPDLLGHAHAEKTLLADIAAGRLPHAIVFSGPVGIGKATLAYRLARYLLAQGGDAGGLFGDAPESLYIAPDHPVARRIVSGGHADVLVIEREFDEKRGRFKNDISVESVRAVHPFLRKTAAEGGWRVVIVDSAEYLNHNSQNALLKILEEPPKRTLLILTTSQPGAFLPTIRSRVRMMPLEPLADKDMEVLLSRFAPDAAPDSRRALITLSAGSIGKALHFHAEDGVTLYNDVIRVVDSLPDLDMLLVHDLAEKYGKFGAERAYETLAEIVTGWCARMARLEARGESAVHIMQGDADVFSRLAATFPPRHFMAAWEKTSLLFRQATQYNLDKKQAIATAFVMLQNPAHAGLEL